VRKYRLGLVIPEHDVQAAVAAIRELTADPAQWIAQARPDWDAYLKAHSAEQLQRSMADLLRRALN
jgi:hypothetical protein